MKRALFFLTALSFAALLNSCGVVDFSNEKPEITAPTVNSNNGDVIISIPPHGGYKYVNVIRYEVADGSAGASSVQDSAVMIGQAIPQNVSAGENDSPKLFSGNILFYDHYTDNTKFYRYYVQYMTASGRVVSSSTGTVQGAGTGEIALTATPVPVRSDYDSSSGVLMLTKSFFDPMPETAKSEPGNEEYFKLMIALSNGTRKQLFELSEANVKIQGVDTEVYTINLKARLPESYIGSEITIEGFTGHQEDKDPGLYTSLDVNKPNFINYYWTKPVAK
ncbi:MAG: hypothetical protein J5780_02350, partial [Treponema sp.]|nr:hypothetical protein [Treponema sp.]